MRTVENGSVSPGLGISSLAQSLVTHRRTGVVVHRADEANTGKKEDAAQQPVNDQTFDLPCAGGLHKDDGTINQSRNTQHGQDNPKYTLDVHTTSLTRCLAKKLPA